MLWLIVRRLLQLPLILLVIYTLTLTLAWAVPGNPLENPEGRRPPPEVEAAMKAQYKLDSFPKFYWSYLENATGLRWVRETVGRARRRRRDRATGGAGRRRSGASSISGPSLQYDDWTRERDHRGEPAGVGDAGGAGDADRAGDRAGGAGWSARCGPNSWADLATLAVALVGISLPSFVIGTVLLLVFPVWLGLGAGRRVGRGRGD